MDALQAADSYKERAACVQATTRARWRPRDDRCHRRACEVVKPSQGWTRTTLTAAAPQSASGPARLSYRRCVAIGIGLAVVALFVIGGLLIQQSRRSKLETAVTSTGWEPVGAPPPSIADHPFLNQRNGRVAGTWTRPGDGLGLVLVRSIVTVEPDPMSDDIGGPSDVPQVGVAIPLPGPVPAMWLRPSGRMTRIADSRDKAEVTTGDGAFDGAFTVRGDAANVSAFLGPELRDALRRADLSNQFYVELGGTAAVIYRTNASAAELRRLSAAAEALAPALRRRAEDWNRGSSRR
jgi:hypothetical protein